MKTSIFLIFLVGLLIVGCTPQSTQQQKEVPLRITVKDFMVKGDLDAPVTFVDFSDYECPFCKKFYTESLPLIEKKYIATGKVKFVFKDYPLAIHKNAVAAAIAARCAGEQSKFWEYHDLLFDKSKELSEENFVVWARDLELDIKLFKNCQDSPGNEQAILQDVAEGQAAGVRGTPTFFVNNKRIAGPHPHAYFEEVIDAALGVEAITNTSSGKITCNTDKDCKESRTMGPYCSANKPNEKCAILSGQKCSLPGTPQSECVVQIIEKCVLCKAGKTCSEGKCVAN